METTPRLGLELVQAQQAQKHVTVNESFRRLDALVQLSAVSATTAEEPASPSAGAIYILPAGKSGSAWSAMAEGALAAYQDGAWVEIVPAKGWRAFIEDEAALRIFGGLDWAVLGETQERLGLNTTASDTNRLAVKSDAALLSHDDVTPGSGDARQMINKSAEEKTASVVFQTAWSGRAEFGLNGDDDFSLKVSANGADWREAARFAKADGKASFPSGLKHPETGFAIRSILPVPGATVWSRSIASMSRVTSARAWPRSQACRAACSRWQARSRTSSSTTP
ncbi:MAG: DUF2793 domain-containing protein [Alphaproteobacteria bacterium]|nr:DUF2793 domain-containing protein [Alphaproteobacteria bacterium]